MVVSENQKFIIIADNLSLDFLNTQIVDDGKPIDLLNNFEDLVEWAEAVKLLAPIQAEKLIRNSDGQSETKKKFCRSKRIQAHLTRND